MTLGKGSTNKDNKRSERKKKGSTVSILVPKDGSLYDAYFPCKNTWCYSACLFSILFMFVLRNVANIFS